MASRKRSEVLPDQALRLISARRQKFKTAKAAADFHGWNYATYSQHERGINGLRKDSAEKYARAFGVTAGWLLTGDGERAAVVPVRGNAGAGPDGSVLFSEGDQELGEAPAPPNYGPTTVALKVRGESMRGIAEDGWYVYYDERHDPPSDHMLGRLCVVGLADGRVMVKWLHRGRGLGRFDLESRNAATLRDVPVDWAAVVTALVPN